jgi:murein DD-endopeptidase MepM/ murein hydrolase activator NlpD
VHIILVSDRMATARSITITGGHLAFFATGLVMVVLALSSLFSYLTVRHAAEIRLPFLQEMLRTTTLEETGKTRELLRDSLSSMAVRLGQMQGQLMQLDTLGERLAGLAGVKLQERAKSSNDGVAKSADAKGGPLIRPDNLTELEMQRALTELAQQIEVRSQTLAILDDRLFDERIRKQLLPTSTPVEADVRASGFGWRTDPFTGQTAMHEGVDFMAEPGTPILAAGAGIVAKVERHPEYGNMVEIDHGDGLITRYAHASQVFVKPGELVKSSQRIAAVGSTGRSTGPHLHFEVRLKGVAQNPSRFLAQGATQLARH